MSRHYSDEERPGQNSGRQTLPEKTFSKHKNTCPRTKQFQRSYVCLPNMTKLFIRSKRSSTKAYSDHHHQSPNRRKLVL